MLLFIYYLPRRRRPGTGDIATPPVRLSVRLSVCPSVTFSFRTVTQKRIDVFSRNFAGNFFFQYFKFSSRFMLFPTLNKKIPGGGGVDFFLWKTILSHFTFYAIFNIKKNIEKCPFTYWLNGRWFLQIVERDSWNLYTLYPLFPCSDFVSQMWGWFGGGGCNVFLTFYAISNISRKKKSGNTKQLFLI